MAGQFDMVKELIAQGADVNAADENGFTPIMYAFSYPDIVSLYIDADADLTLKNNGGETVVMVAAKVGDIRSLRRVVDAGADCTSFRDGQQKSALDYAATKGESAEGLTFILKECGAEF